VLADCTCRFMDVMPNFCVDGTRFSCPLQFLPPLVVRTTYHHGTTEDHSENKFPWCHQQAIPREKWHWSDQTHSRDPNVHEPHRPSAIEGFCWLLSTEPYQELKLQYASANMAGAGAACSEVMLPPIRTNSRSTGKNSSKVCHLLYTGQVLQERRFWNGDGYGVEVSFKQCS